MPSSIVAKLSRKEQLADKYLSWSVSLLMAAKKSAKKEGRDVDQMLRMSDAAKLKALALLAD